MKRALHPRQRPRGCVFRRTLLALLIGGSYLVELAAASGTPGVNWDLWSVSRSLNILSDSSSNSRFKIALASGGVDAG